MAMAGRIADRLRAAVSWFVHPDRDKSVVMVLLTRLSAVLGVALPFAAFMGWAVLRSGGGSPAPPATTGPEGTSEAISAAPAPPKPPAVIDDGAALALVFPQAVIELDGEVLLAVTDPAKRGQPLSPAALDGPDSFFQLINAFSYVQDGATRRLLLVAGTPVEPEEWFCGPCAARLGGAILQADANGDWSMVDRNLALGSIGNQSYLASRRDVRGLEKIGADTSAVLLENTSMNTGSEAVTLAIIADIDGRLVTVFDERIESGNRSSGLCDENTGAGCVTTSAEYRFVDRSDGRPWDLVIDSSSRDGTGGTVVTRREQRVYRFADGAYRRM